MNSQPKAQLQGHSEQLPIDLSLNLKIGPHIYKRVEFFFLSLSTGKYCSSLKIQKGEKYSFVLLLLNTLISNLKKD